MKLFLDANIIFTAAYTPQGASGFLFSIAEAGAITLCTSLYALDEAKRNLALKAADKFPSLEKLLPHMTIVSEPQPEKEKDCAGQLKMPGLGPGVAPEHADDEVERYRVTGVEE